MVDITTVSSDWLVLFHHLPPKPDYLRVKLRRRLNGLGALPLRNSVYVLPRRTETLEDFQWLASEIRGDGGDAVLCDTRFLDGVTDTDVIAQFDARATSAYDAVAAAARDALTGHRATSATPESRRELQREHSRLSKQLDDVSRTDFFQAQAGARARVAVDAISAAAQPGRDTADAAAASTSATIGHVWVTRADIFVDRMASAWLIRRFIDPEARFKFVQGGRYAAQPGEVRFDIARGEYTHEGDRCTFEVLCQRFELDAVGLAAIAEIVHDIDLKDDKFARPEADGVGAILRGFAAGIPDDESRVQIAMSVFDGLLAKFSAGSAG
jgi:hypothetical protein